jgi:hypothetical protein
MQQNIIKNKKEKSNNEKNIGIIQSALEQWQVFAKITKKIKELKDC